MKIGLDLDGVIIDHTENKMVLARRLGYDLSPQQTQSDEILKIVPPEVLSVIQKAIYDDSDIAMSAGLVDGAAESLKRLKKDFIPFYLISRRHSPQVAIDLLKSKSLWPEYFDDNNTFFVSAAGEKNIKSKELGITHFLDDEKNVIDILTDVPQRFWFDVFNIFKDGDAYTRVVSWDDFLRKINA